MSDSNSQLIESIVGGELHRFAEVVRRFDQQVRIAISRRIQDPAAVEDLTQETFYKAFRNLGRLHDPDQLASWLVAIARNCVRDYFRRKSVREEKELASGTAMATRRQAEAAANPDWVWDEVNLLSDEFAEILRLRYQQACSYREMAQQLGLPESTVRGRIYEARKALRQRLSEKGLF